MSLLPSLRHAPAALLRGLQACASSCHAVASTSTSRSPACACSACCRQGFSTAAASPSPSQQEQEQGQQGQEPRKETLQEIRARVFEQHLGDNVRSGRKFLLRPLKGPALQDWYMTDIGGSKPLLDDDMETQ
jgi:hypothetical protein